MNAWRQTTPEPVQTEIDSLVRVALGVAQERLATQGMLNQAVVAADRTGSFETETEVMVAKGPSDSLTGRLVRHPEEFRAVAVVSTGRSGDNDMIRIHVEHDAGVALEISARYDVVGLCGGVAFQEFESQQVSPELWATTLVGT